MTLRRVEHLLDSWVFAARGSVVDCVWRRGHKVVSAGRHIRRDAIAQRFQRALARLLA
jgi:formimidoylglutamate deiminase